jgi:hypothetical protein
MKSKECDRNKEAVDKNIDNFIFSLCIQCLCYKKFENE